MSVDDLVEKTARALFRHDQGPLKYYTDMPWEPSREYWTEAARSAILAVLDVIREPTPDMSTAGKHAVKGCESTFERDIAETAYRVMIDALRASVEKEDV